jgi:asparagine synthase (glutamine-hydrolysing)
MCGISAVFSHTEISDSDKCNLHSMNSEMNYRGPDDRGVWYDQHCGMAQVRLSIIGLEKGKQPLFNEDQSLVLICNGEIYNYLELKSELVAKGHHFNSQSDSETILHLYEEYGVKCLDFLRGMFAFCLWDIKKQELFVARDRIGEKTLYYSQLQTGVVFCTELKAILKYYIPRPQLNFEQLVAPIRYTAPTNKLDTYIDQIKRVEPGQYIVVNNQGIIKNYYWKRNVSTSFTGTYEDAKAETLRLLRESIDINMRSDVPIAVMLSGGVDSSAIAAIAKESGREVHTITAGYKGQHDCDERDVAKRFAKERGFIYHEVELDEEDFKNCFDELTQYIDEPITDSAALAQWALYKKVKSLGFKVLLGGMGGDELFYGYPYWNRLGESLTLHRQHQALLPWKGIERKIEFVKFALKNLRYILLAGYPYKIEDRSICYWNYDDYRCFVKNGFFLNQNESYSLSDIHFNHRYDKVQNISEIDEIYKFSFDHIMVRAYLYLSDRLGMGNSLEIRSPLLDYKLVDFVSSLPLNFKYKKDHPKCFLKDVLSGIVPEYILFAEKRGFTPPTEFINKIVMDYNYKNFKSEHKFYNSILVDKLTRNLL